MNALEVRNQIRRTEGELMEMGTMEDELLQDHSEGADRTGRPAAEPNRIVA